MAYKKKSSFFWLILVVVFVALLGLFVFSGKLFEGAQDKPKCPVCIACPAPTSTKRPTTEEYANDNKILEYSKKYKLPENIIKFIKDNKGVPKDDEKATKDFINQVYLKCYHRYENMSSTMTRVEKENAFKKCIAGMPNYDTQYYTQSRSPTTIIL